MEIEQADPNRVRVPIQVRWDDNFCLPDPDGEEMVEAVFKMMTFGDHFAVEQACRIEVEKDGRKSMVTDYNEMRRLTIKRNLIDWDIDIPIEREHGWLTPDCYSRVGSVFGPLLEAFLDGFWSKVEVTADEEKQIDRQASILFSKNSRGVVDACEAIRMYCTMGTFSEKFGITYKDLPDLPFRDYVMLKIMVGHENEATRRQSKVAKTPTTRIAGAGGRTRPSRGTSIPL